MPQLVVILFGAPEIRRDGATVKLKRRKSLALLAYLALSGQAYSRDALATLLWPDLDQAHGHTVLRSVLADLHRALGHEGLATEGDQVCLRVAPEIEVDVVRFRALVASVTAHHPTAHPLCDACLAALTEAANLYTADFLAGFSLADAVDFDAWQTLQTETLRLELADVLEKLASALADAGQRDAALGCARRWLALDPLHEPAHRLIMRLHAGAGDRAAAIRQYQECAKVLREELGVEPEPATATLLDTLRASPSPALPLSSVPPANLPSDLTPFIGREPELAQVAERLADPACRLLTVCGPGGMGKTRLAVQAARHASNRFRQGICFVDLAPLTAADLLSATILRQLRAPHAATEPDEYLLSYLADKQMLLVLDNYEHLLSGPESDLRDGYGLVTKLVAAAPEVKLLITSRTRLNVRAEWLAPLEGLESPGERDPHPDPLPPRERERAPSYPAPLSEQTREPAPSPARGEGWGEGDLDLEGYSATALFLACVRRVRPGFQPSADEVRCIARICRLLAGVPLAIELAAAWSRALPPAQIERELEHGLDLLQSTARDAVPRHRSMTAAFDHSWRLLSTRQRSILRQLVVFRGGFTREAAQEVAGAALAELADLADASWVRVAPTGRYEVHELARQYCAEKLAAEHERETGDLSDRVRDRHAAYFMARLRTRQEVVSTWQDRFQPLLPDWDNFSAVWRRSIARDEFGRLRDLLAIFGQEDVAAHVKLQVLEPIQQMLEVRLRSRANGAEDAEAALLMARLLLRRARCYGQMGKLAQAIADIETGLERLDELPRTSGWIETRLYLRMTQAYVLTDRGDHEASIQMRHALLEELPQIHEQLWPYQPDRTLLYWQAEITAGLFYPLHRLGRYEEAERVTRQALQWFAAMPWACNANALANLGELHHLRGEYGEALRLGIESLHANEAHGQQVYSLISLLTIARAKTALGRLAEARAHYHRVHAVSRALGRPATLARSMAGLAELELALGRSVKARETYEAMLAFCEQNEVEWGELEAIARIGLGRAALALGDPAAAEAAFSHALRCRGRFAVTTMDAIAGLAQVSARAGEAARAVELGAFVAAHSATSHQVRQLMAPLVAELEVRLPADQFAAATARGRARELGEVVRDLLPEDDPAQPSGLSDDREASADAPGSAESPPA